MRASLSRYPEAFLSGACLEVSLLDKVQEELVRVEGGDECVWIVK